MKKKRSTTDKLKALLNSRNTPVTTFVSVALEHFTDENAKDFSVSQCVKIKSKMASAVP
jgi:hypothetical protein